MKRLQESERRFREKEFELIKQLDEVTLSTSQAELERTRLANEKLRLEQEVRRHEAREAELVRERKDAENCLVVAKERVENEVCKKYKVLTYMNLCLENFRTLKFLYFVFGVLYIEVVTKMYCISPAFTIFTVTFRYLELHYKPSKHSKVL